MTTREEAIRAAGTVLAHIRHLIATRTPRESAEAAWVPGGPSLDELERRIRVLRGELPESEEDKQRDQAALRRAGRSASAR
ncbi:hypothetical protein SAMN04488000_118131 [Lentzea albida]|uniref:Uncharacterized protein n=1 Tax=Lentzea albida TaxID=65499 RepID=A0A1H9VIX3_9PSEU|nr:hypothetical protein SAMN04488000_118131 [Lentzea albida]